MKINFCLKNDNERKKKDKRRKSPSGKEISQVTFMRKKIPFSIV